MRNGASIGSFPLDDPRKSPLAPLFQREVLLWDREELQLTVRNSPFFQRGIKGDFAVAKRERLRISRSARNDMMREFPGCDTVSRRRKEVGTYGERMQR